MECPLVMFDMGSVAVEVESDRLVHQIAQLLGRPFEEIQQGVYHQDLLLPFELGRISARAYYEGLKDRKSTRLNSSHSAKSRMPSSA